MPVMQQPDPWVMLSATCIALLGIIVTAAVAYFSAKRAREAQIVAVAIY